MAAQLDPLRPPDGVDSDFWRSAITNRENARRMGVANWATEFPVPKTYAEGVRESNLESAREDELGRMLKFDIRGTSLTDDSKSLLKLLAANVKPTKPKHNGGVIQKWDGYGRYDLNGDFNEIGKGSIPSYMRLKSMMDAEPWQVGHLSPNASNFQALVQQAQSAATDVDVSAYLGVSPQQPQATAATPQSSLLDTWQQYGSNQGWSQQAAQQTTPPAQMSLGQAQPQAATSSVSAGTSSAAYPGQRYQPQSLGGFNWQQSQQRQGQQPAPMQTGQQSFPGMSGGYRQRRQPGLGMLAQHLIA